MFQANTRLIAAALLLPLLPSAVRAQAPRNVNIPGAQVLPQVPLARVVPFQPQNANPARAVFGPAPLALTQPSAIQLQLATAHRALAITAFQRRQLAALLQEQLQLAGLQDQLNVWGSQPLTPLDQQQLAALQETLAALQQQNMLQQLAILQP
jgi:hypothetical protein